MALVGKLYIHKRSLPAFVVLNKRVYIANLEVKIKTKNQQYFTMKINEILNLNEILAISRDWSHMYGIQNRETTDGRDDLEVSCVDQGMEDVT